MKCKKSILLLLIVLLSFPIIGLFVKNRIRTQVKDLFRMNKVLQEEGYYMGEFEFKMLGIGYYLDKGRYIKAISTLSRFHSQLMNKENLIKIPEFKDNQEKMNFYLNLQNPKTGAFMDDSFPYCTFNEPTENVIAHLDELAKKMGVPLKLKYPLKYLDRINTPEKLYEFLDDVSYIGWFGSRFPETSFVFARSLASDWNDEGVIGQNNLYSFSDDFKTALLRWFYTNQDSTTGYWGPKSGKNGRLLKIDLNNTASIIKLFVDKNGNNIHESFPLKHKDKIFETTIDFLKKSTPAADELDEWHAWNLSTNKGIKMLLRYLWKDASNENKQNARRIIEDCVKIIFEKYYVPDEGAFSYYPNTEHASLDGTGGFIFSDIGAFSYEKQKKLWGEAAANIKDLGRFKTTVLSKTDLDLITKNPGINSLRIYHTMPDDADLTDDVFMLVYPHKTQVLDVMELVPKITRWLDTVTLSVGNWTSLEQIKKEYSSLSIKEPIVYRQIFPLDRMNEILLEKKELHIIDFDILQIPRYRIVYLYPPEIK
jgi:hypothetical protein